MLSVIKFRSQSQDKRQERFVVGWCIFFNKGGITMKRYWLLTFLVFAVVSIASAKGMADKITITTPDGQTFDVTDPQLVEHLSMAALEVFPNSIPEPQVTGNSYELARAYKDGNTYRIFDRIRYYPSGAGGYVFYIG